MATQTKIRQESYDSEEDKESKMDVDETFSEIIAGGEGSVQYYNSSDDGGEHTTFQGITRPITPMLYVPMTHGNTDWALYRPTMEQPPSNVYSHSAGSVTDKQDVKTYLSMPSPVPNPVNGVTDNCPNIHLAMVKQVMEDVVPERQRLMKDNPSVYHYNEFADIQGALTF